MNREPQFAITHDGSPNLIPLIINRISKFASAKHRNWDIVPIEGAPSAVSLTNAADAATPGCEDELAMQFQLFQIQKHPQHK